MLVKILFLPLCCRVGLVLILSPTDTHPAMIELCIKKGRGEKQSCQSKYTTRFLDKCVKVFQISLINSILWSKALTQNLRFYIVLPVLWWTQGNPGSSSVHIKWRIHTVMWWSTDLSTLNVFFNSLSCILHRRLRKWRAKQLVRNKRATIVQFSFGN